MIKQISKNNAYVFLFFVSLSILVALRPVSVGKDSDGYGAAFVSASLTEGIAAPRWEIGFRLFMEFVGLFTSSPYIFFFVIALLISMLMFFTYQRSVDNRSVTNDVIFIALLIFSRWYITEMTNGIRQGISLAILYWAIMAYLKEFKYIRFFIIYLLALSFHLAIIFVLPFILLVHTNIKSLSIIWCSILVLYIVGLNERVVEYAAGVLSLDIYEQILYYSVADRTLLQSAKWVGLQWDQLFYTVFFAVLALIVVFIKNLGRSNKETLIFVLKTYMVLSLPYFTFGFGPYSNRYAVMSWFFTPVLVSAVIHTVKLKRRDVVKCTPILLLASIFYFMIKRLDWAGAAFG